LNSNWFIELKFNRIERLFHQYRVQHNLIGLPPSLNARIAPQQVALVDDFVREFEHSLYEKFNLNEIGKDNIEYLDKMKKYFCNKCSILNDLISCWASNLTDNEIQIYFYRKMIRLINELTSGKPYRRKVQETASA